MCKKPSGPMIYTITSGASIVDALGIRDFLQWLKRRRKALDGLPQANLNLPIPKGIKLPCQICKHCGRC